MSALSSLETAVVEETHAIRARSIAYLVSRYPMLSMIFIIREVVQLRELGFRIEVASINPPDRAADELTRVEAAEASRTYQLKTHGIAGAARAHWMTLCTNPAGYWRGLKLVARLGGADLRRLALNFIYFSEGLMVGLWMRRNGQRHLHVHLGQQAATVGLYTRHVFQCGYSITVHGPDEFYDAQGQYLAEKIAAADFISCISFFCRSQLMKFAPYEHWKKFVVCRLGVDPNIFEPRARRAVDVFEILCVGRLTPAKGQHMLIDAVQQLAERGRPVRLRIVGEGPDGAALRAHASSIDDSGSIIFEGAVNQDHIRQLYASADVFCIPSVAEGIPVVLMEAMAMEIPCVTTHITGIPELIRDGVDGFLVAPSDLDGLTAALTRLMDDPALCERIGRNARARVIEHYNLRRNVETLATVFAERIPSES
jgi:glycosyltransferase involved in cell wall biosynthesis